MNEHTVSLEGLKTFALQYLEDGSSLKELILSEPQELPREEAIGRALVYSRLLRQELGSKKRLDASIKSVTRPSNSPTAEA